jgi:hypothetical protein
MALVVAGLLNKQIAGELGTSETTVKIQRHQVMEKMAADSLADLVRMADKLGVSTPWKEVALHVTQWMKLRVLLPFEKGGAGGFIRCYSAISRSKD